MDARAGRHGLHIYRSDAHLTGCAARFAKDALLRGEPVILAPSRAHRAGVIAALKSARVLVEALEGAGLLVIADAEDGWSRLMEALSEFRARGFSRAAIWGETGDLMLKAGRPEEFLSLERRWREAVEAGGLDVLCSYRANLLDESLYAGELTAVCGGHSHVSSFEAPPELEGAVDAAFVEVMGHRDTGMAWSLASQSDALPKALPSSVHRLGWVAANMPATYKKVFAAARAKTALSA
jgi:hypothetical protein